MKIRRIGSRTMSPDLTPGAIVVTRHQQPRLGDIVLAIDQGREVVMRLVAMNGAELTLENNQHPKRRSVINRHDVLGSVWCILPGPRPAPLPRRPHARIFGACAAAPLIAMATAQLMSFDKFIVVLDRYGLPVSGAPIGAISVVFTVAAIPYLLSMALSPAARIVSMFAGWLTAAMWLLLGLWSMSHTIESTGHFGDIIATSPGLWAIAYGMVLLVLVGLAQHRLRWR